MFARAHVCVAEMNFKYDEQKDQRGGKKVGRWEGGGWKEEKPSVPVVKACVSTNTKSVKGDSCSLLCGAGKGG